MGLLLFCMFVCFLTSRRWYMRCALVAGVQPCDLPVFRGQAQNSPNPFSDASVGIYIDGVYVGRPMVGNLGFLDMASAEVLRGPQGPLFGRNTTGGALNLTTAQPTNKLEGYIQPGIGNRSEERRGGTEVVRTCRSRWAREK